MRILSSLLLFGVSLAACASTGFASATAIRPFIERVRPDDYLGAERLFPEEFSKTYEWVVLRTDAGKPVSVMAIKPTPGGEGYTLLQQFASADAPDGWLKITEELDGALGKQILRAIEFKLHRQVSLSDFKRTVSKTDTDIWLYQRLSDRKVAAAWIAVEATLGNPAASAFIDDFLGSLQRLIGTEGEARNELLLKIDRTATEIILAEGR